jgi:hypothetical protein
MPSHDLEALGRFGASCNGLISMLGASIPNNDLEALQRFGASCNGFISMLRASIPNNDLEALQRFGGALYNGLISMLGGPQCRVMIWRPYDVLEHRVMASYQCSEPRYRI